MSPSPGLRPGTAPAAPGTYPVVAVVGPLFPGGGGSLRGLPRAMPLIYGERGVADSRVLDHIGWQRHDYDHIFIMMAIKQPISGKVSAIMNQPALIPGKWVGHWLPAPPADRLG